jgi:hypothetical protein
VSDLLRSDLCLDGGGADYPELHEKAKRRAVFRPAFDDWPSPALRLVSVLLGVGVGGGGDNLLVFPIACIQSFAPVIVDEILAVGFLVQIIEAHGFFRESE